MNETMHICQHVKDGGIPDVILENKDGRIDMAACEACIDRAMSEVELPLIEVPRAPIEGSPGEFPAYFGVQWFMWLRDGNVWRGTKTLLVRDSLGNEVPPPEITVCR